VRLGGKRTGVRRVRLEREVSRASSRPKPTAGTILRRSPSREAKAELKIPETQAKDATRPEGGRHAERRILAGSRTIRRSGGTARSMRSEAWAAAGEATEAGRHDRTGAPADIVYVGVHSDSRTAR
jgi:hypothetical protein